MSRFLRVAGLVLGVVLVFFLFLVLGNPEGPRVLTSANLELALTQTARAMGGLLSILACVALLSQATKGASVGQVLSPMLALLGGLLLMKTEWVTLVVFASLGLVYAGYDLLTLRRSPKSDDSPIRG